MNKYIYLSSEWVGGWRTATGLLLVIIVVANDDGRRLTEAILGTTTGWYSPMAINSRGFGGSGHGKRVGPGSCLVGRLVIMSFAWWIDGWTEDRLRGGCKVKEKETAFVLLIYFNRRRPWGTLYCWEFRKENIVTMCFSGWVNKLKFVGNWHCTIARWVRWGWWWLNRLNGSHNII